MISWRQLWRVSEELGREIAWTTTSNERNFPDKVVIGDKYHVDPPIKYNSNTIYHTHTTHDGIYCYPPSVEDVFCLFYLYFDGIKKSIIISDEYTYIIYVTDETEEFLKGTVDLSTDELNAWRRVVTNYIQLHLNRVHKGLLGIQKYLNLLENIFSVRVEMISDSGCSIQLAK
jgi:hypothetical protein